MTTTPGVQDVAALLEQAAESMKHLLYRISLLCREIGGAHDVKTSVDLLTAQVQTLHGTLAKNHADVIAHSQKVLAATEKHAKQQEEHANQQRLSRLAIQAQVHHRMAIDMRANHNQASSRITPKQKSLALQIAQLYGWKLGEKSHSAESTNAHYNRRWEDALDCLEIVTVPHMTYDGAAYNNFVR
ncbi:hypothetical protein RI054_12g62600 [Pseudoscourfieldia marina]